MSTPNQHIKLSNPTNELPRRTGNFTMSHLVPQFSDMASAGGIYPGLKPPDELPAEIHSLREQLYFSELQSTIKDGVIEQVRASVRELQQSLIEEKGNRVAAQTMAETDHLTKLLSRLGIEKEYAQFQSGQFGGIRRSDTAGTEAFILLIDADNFKRINDQYGLRGGDKLLKEIADSMQNSVRRNDILARWGGDEFVAILPRIKEKRATQIADYIRQRVGDSAAATVSIGVGKIDFSLTLEDNVNKANYALSVAKSKGKDVVVSM